MAVAKTSEWMQLPAKVRRAIERFNRAAVQKAMMGFMEPCEFGGVEGEFNNSKVALIRTLITHGVRTLRDG